MCDYISAFKASGGVTSVAPAIGKGVRVAAATVSPDRLLREYTCPPISKMKSSVAATGVEEPTVALGDTIILNLFEDVAITGVVSRVGGDAFGSVFSATVNGLESMTIIDTPAGRLINVQRVEAKRVYTVVPTASGTTVREYEPPLSENTNDAIVPDLSAASADGEPVAQSESSFQTASTLLDVLVVYDDGALLWANQSGGGITNFARTAVAKMNNALANSGLDAYFNFRLVDVACVSATVTDLETALYAAKDGTGAWAAVKTRRTAVGADVVTVLIDTGSAYGTTGLGFSLSSTPVSGFSEWAYNCCSVRSVAIAHTMTHEVGHNVGAGHSDKQSSAPGPQWDTTKPYSCGYYFTGTDGKKYHTIMAYGNDGYGGTYIDAPLFSSPLVTYQGTVAGTTANNDNARVIRETYAEASKWRSQVVPVTHGVTFSPESGTSFSDSLTVTLTPGLAGLQIYYTLDGSTPTTSSTRYTGAITLTKTTTISAITWDGKNASPVYTATYHISDIGVGLDAPRLNWTMEGDVAWSFQTTDTHDGVDAVQTIWTKTWQKSYLSTTVSGPTDFSFWYKTRKYLSDFVASVDGTAVYSESATSYGDEWTLVQIPIPAGSHTVKFTFKNSGGYFTSGDYGSAVIDEIAFDRYAQQPVITPETSSTLDSAKTFTGELEVTISAPEGATVYYTTDMSTPTTESTPYTRPFTITKSTLVSAIAVQNGKEPSPVAKALYVERHTLEPGEWTTDIDQATQLASENGGWVVTMLANLATCPYCELFDPIAESASFRAWAKANNVYLVTADASRHPDTADADNFFWDKWSNVSSGGVGYPTLIVTDASGTAKGYLLARSGQSVNSVTYDGTVDSLVRCIGSFLGTPPSAPTLSPADTLINAFPVTVTLSNPNGSGTLRYTLDGSAPTRSSPVYSKTITITSSDQILQAAVWPSSEPSSPVVVANYKTVNEVMGTSGVVWSFGTSGASGWCASEGTFGSIQSGTFIGTGNSWIQGEFQGKGKLIYTVTTKSNSLSNKSIITVDGNAIYSQGYTEALTTLFSKTFTNEFTTATSHTVRWAYNVGNFAYYYNGYTKLTDLVWIPEDAATTSGIPHSLIEEKAAENPEFKAILDSEKASGGNYETLVSKIAGNGKNTIGDCLIAGISPTDKGAKFTAKIEIVNGEPVITYTPNLGQERRYITEGCAELGGAWKVINTDADKEGLRFFKVTVTLP